MKTIICTCAACTALSFTLFVLVPPQREAVEALTTTEQQPVVNEAKLIHESQLISTTTTTMLKQIDVKPGRPKPELDSPSYEPESMQALIAEWFPENPRLWNAIAECESTWNPNAYNAEGASGLFQIMMPLHQDMLQPGENIYDPLVNIRIARSLSKNGTSTTDWNASKVCWSRKI